MNFISSVTSIAPACRVLEHHEGEVVRPPVPPLAVASVPGVAHTLDRDDDSAPVRVIVLYSTVLYCTVPVWVVRVHMVSAEEGQPPQVAVVARLPSVLLCVSKLIGN